MDLKSFEDLKEKESLEYKITLAEDRSDAHLKLYLMARWALIALGHKNVIDQIEKEFLMDEKK